MLDGGGKLVPILDLNHKLEGEKCNKVSENERGRSCDLLHIVPLGLPSFWFFQLERKMGDSGECSEFTAGGAGWYKAAPQNLGKAESCWWLLLPVNAFHRTSGSLAVATLLQQVRVCTVCSTRVTPHLNQPPLFLLFCWFVYLFVLCVVSSVLLAYMFDCFFVCLLQQQLSPL